MSFFWIKHRKLLDSTFITLHSLRHWFVFGQQRKKGYLGFNNVAFQWSHDMKHKTNHVKRNLAETAYLQVSLKHPFSSQLFSYNSFFPWVLEFDGALSYWSFISLFLWIQLSLFKIFSGLFMSLQIPWNNHWNLRLEVEPWKRLT